MFAKSRLVKWRQVGKRARRAARVAPAPVEAPAAAPIGNRNRQVELWIYAALVVAVWAVYWQARHFDFVNFDDPEYLAGNPHVRAGITWAGLKWAFLSTTAANWFPLTWISHMTAYHSLYLFDLDSQN